METIKQAITRAVSLSKVDLIDEIVVIYQKANGNYGVCLEAEYTGESDMILGRYLNGRLAVS
jgi:hypothetical protein